MSAYTGNEAAVIELDLIDQAISRQQEERSVGRLSKLQVAGLTGAVTSEQLKINYKPSAKVLSHLRLDFQSIHIFISCFTWISVVYVLAMCNSYLRQ